MAISVNDGGTWKAVTTMYVNDGGTWKAVTVASVHDGASWIQATGISSSPGSPQSGTHGTTFAFTLTAPAGASYSWSFTGTSVGSWSLVSTNGSQTMVVRITPSAAGTYTCTVQCIVGSNTYTIPLQVNAS